MDAQANGEMLTQYSSRLGEIEKSARGKLQHAAGAARHARRNAADVEHADGPARDGAASADDARAVGRDHAAAIG